MSEKPSKSGRTLTDADEGEVPAPITVML